MGRENQAGFKDPTQLTKWTKGLLYAQIVISVVAVASGYFELQLLRDFQEGVYQSRAQAVAAGEASDARQAVVGILQLLIYVIAGVVILMWIYRANYNARQLGATDMAFTPGWAVGWYFVPIANLFKPYQAMKEIWQASQQAHGWQGEEVPSLLPVWWFLWLASGALSNVAARMSWSAEELQDLLAASTVTLISDAAAIPLSGVVLVMFGKIYEMQMKQVSSTA